MYMYVYYIFNHSYSSISIPYNFYFISPRRNLGDSLIYSYLFLFLTNWIIISFSLLIIFCVFYVFLLLLILFFVIDKWCLLLCGVVGVGICVRAGGAKWWEEMDCLWMFYILYLVTKHHIIIIVTIIILIFYFWILSNITLK